MGAGVIGFQAFDHAVQTVPEVDVRHGQQPDFVGASVQFGFERNGVEVDAVGDADRRTPEDFGVVGEGHDAVYPAGHPAAEDAVDAQFEFAHEGRLREFGVVGVGRYFERDAYAEFFDFAQPMNQHRAGVVVVADVEELHALVADVARDVAQRHPFSDLGPQSLSERADRTPADHAALRAVGRDFEVAQLDVGAVPAQGVALGEDLLADAAMGREAVENDE